MKLPSSLWAPCSLKKNKKKNTENPWVIAEHVVRARTMFRRSLARKGATVPVAEKWACTTFRHGLRTSSVSRTGPIWVPVRVTYETAYWLSRPFTNSQGSRTAFTKLNRPLAGLRNPPVERPYAYGHAYRRRRISYGFPTGHMSLWLSKSYGLGTPERLIWHSRSAS